MPSKRWMTLIVLMLAAIIASGCGVCGVRTYTTTAYDEAKDAFQKATLAGAKNCAPCEYATAEAYLAHADHEIAEKTTVLVTLKMQLR